MRRRARCPLKSCPVGSWTVYEEDSYPHRTFALEVLVSAVVKVVLLGATLTAAAAEHLCSRHSVRRWKKWVAQLAEPRDIEGLCLRLDPDGMPVATRRAPRAQQILLLLERLADLLTLRGVDLPRRGSGLVRILVDQLVRFGEVFRLTKSSPPLRADLRRIGL